MKHILITTIAVVLVVGCGPQPPDISIHDASFEGNIEAVKQHIAAGTDVNATSYAKQAPLHNAATKGHKEVVELLIAAGADVNAKTDMGGTPLDGAIGNKHSEIVDLLRKHGSKRGFLKATGN
ncbi:ankyrin repeat domain-containing protein [bacterium]|nr:ankyrin repeat domain-containing protein [bacterium]